MNIKALFFTALTTSLAAHAVLADYTGKAMTDKEIKDLIIKGDISNFDRGACYRKTPVYIEAPINPPDNGSTTRTDKEIISTGTFIPVYTIEATDQVQTKNNPVVNPDRIFKCQCPCPYSLNGKNQECGASSAYFQYPEQYKPKCYPEDVNDWEVNDFRNNREISAPQKRESP